MKSNSSHAALCLQTPKRRSFRLPGFLLAFSALLITAASAISREDFSGMRGANYVPSYAKNDVAIWMDYDPEVIDRELGYAERLKLNTIRVFLNQAVYEQDPKLFLERFENFLSLCAKHKIQAMPVLFDDCFDPQEVDLKGYKDKPWIPSPGFPRLGEKDRPAMAAYIKAVIGGHRKDSRVNVWDVMNEPEGSASQFGDVKPGGGRETIFGFVRWALACAKEQKPVAPVTVGWASSVDNIAAIDLVDVISFHCYEPVAGVKNYLWQALCWGRGYKKPILLTEFAAQTHQRLDLVLPVIAEHKIGWVFWELMIGKSQFTQGPAPYQGHIYPDGTCRSVREVAAILSPEGFQGDPREIAAKAGFQLRILKEEGIVFEGGWQRVNVANAKNGRLWQGGNADDLATKSVEGSTIAITFKHGPDCGIAKILVDGKPARVAELDTFSKEVDWNRKTIVAENLPAGKHTVQILATGNKSAESKLRNIGVVDIEGQP